ncbi:transmembrane protease serine 9-like [Daphnia pulex]|uniref:transmembrane protease serine 9-like n=1 Tax=Daphnia pulex TaxID=6669 RepID=UPI001EDD82CC|nr:transmembrane protease serine 9-like [Daphnia pulex]
MKFVVLATLLTYSWAAPHPPILPRLPINDIVSGHQLKLSEKIIGGVEVVPNSLPFQVSIQRGSAGVYTQSCGGSILNETTVLTAAHCVDGAVVRALRVVAGEHSLNNESGLEQNRDVAFYSMHPRYTASTWEDDIALIVLTEPFDLSVPSAKPVNLPPPTSEYDAPAGTVFTVSGWGTTRYGGILVSDVLLSVDVPVVADVDCDAYYGGTSEKPEVYPSMLCAGNTTDGGIDACQGDSGGPLFSGSGETAVQHGIVSWGKSCAEPQWPGVYTQVSYFVEWIALAIRQLLSLTKMKCFLLATLLVFAWAAPQQRAVLPRLPLNIILNKRFQNAISSDRILSGSEVVPNSLPFQVSLQRRGLNGAYVQVGGGSILDDSTILHAAHGVVGIMSLVEYRIVAGEHSLSVDSGLEQIRAVSSIVTHPNFDDITYEDDISLIFLTEPLDLSVPSAKPIALPGPTAEFDPPAGFRVNVSGWGTTTSDGDVSDVLRSVEVPVIPDFDCDAAYGGDGVYIAVFPSMVCAGDTVTSRIPYCQGDSGGPFFTGTGETAVQHGIVSWGQSCTYSQFPGVYTQVSYYLDWIAANRR